MSTGSVTPATTRSTQDLPRNAGAFATVVFGFLTVALSALVGLGDLTTALLALGMAAFVTGIAVFGMTTCGTAMLCLAYATAPAYKGLAPEKSTVTPTDLLVVIGFALLIPMLLRGRLRLPLPFVIAGAMILGVGGIATAMSQYPLLSGLSLVMWFFVVIGLPTCIVLWNPSSKVIELLAWSYIVGQFGSWGLGIATGGITPTGRHIGLTNHPNYFAEAGMMGVALAMFLFYRQRTVIGRTLAMGAAGLCGLSILFSGSRGATLMVAVLIVLIPVVERSAIAGFLWAILGALGIAMLPLLLELTGNAAAVERLLGDAGTTGSDAARSQGLEHGIATFWDHPWFGIGVLDIQLFEIHNTMVEVAVAIGFLGPLAYLFLLFSLARPLFGTHPERRLAYVAWAFLGWCLLIPSLYDRTLWLPLALVAVTWIPAAQRGRNDEVEAPAADLVSSGTPPTLKEA